MFLWKTIDKYEKDSEIDLGVGIIAMLKPKKGQRTNIKKYICLIGTKGIEIIREGTNFQNGWRVWFCLCIQFSTWIFLSFWWFLIFPINKSNWWKKFNFTLILVHSSFSWVWERTRNFWNNRVIQLSERFKNDDKHFLVLINLWYQNQKPIRFHILTENLFQCKVKID